MPETRTVKGFSEDGLPLAEEDFECGPFNHLGTSPYISVCFILKKFLERKAGENTEKYSIFDFENPLKSRISGGRNDQVAVKFRVRPVMTTSIRFLIHNG